MSVIIRDMDHGYREQMNRLFTVFPPVKVGVSNQEHSGSAGRTIEDIGMMHEFGLGVPQRSFLRSWIDKNQNTAQAVLAKLARQYVDGVISLDELYNTFGRWCVRGVKQQILSNIPPQLAESTVKKKGHDKSLVDSGQLLNGIVFEVDHKLGVYVRVQPAGRSLQGHTSGLAYEKVKGIFAAKQIAEIQDTYTWVHVQRQIKAGQAYEAVVFTGELVDMPGDSEGVVVNPIAELSRELL